MRIIVSLLLASYFFVNPSLADDKKISFDAQAALSYIKDLASDRMMGRKSGQPGGTLAEEYVASRFREWRVEPGGENGTYFQRLNINHYNIEAGVKFEVIAEKGRRDFHYRDDWRVWSYSGSGHFNSEIVFVGYGIHAPEKGYDDYAGVNVDGKIVLLILETPISLEENFREEVDLERRIIAAQEQGARVVLMCFSPVRGNRRIQGRITKKAYKKDFVILRVEDSVGRFIFKDLPTELRYLIQEMDRTSKPMPYETGVKAFISVEAIFDTNRPTRNVLGKISGTDDKLKDECIIIGAHLDHIGFNPLGEVMNGANDNASGSAVAMEIARILKLNKTKLKRTVIFFLWAAEEQHEYAGLLHYLGHPLMPLEKTVTYINMDMVGHGSGRIRFGPVDLNAYLWKILKKKLPREILDYLAPLRGHQRIVERKTCFPAKGIPRFGMSTEGFHFKYHEGRDDPDLIKPELLKKTGDLVHGMVEILALEPGNLIPPLRKVTMFMMHLTLFNFKMMPSDDITRYKKEEEDAVVDVQLALLESKKGLDKDALKVDIINNLFAASDKIKKSRSHAFYSSPSWVSGNINRGMTTVILGIDGIDVFSDDSRWIEILADKGISFVLLNNPSFLFKGEGLSEEGEKIMKALRRNRILPLISGMNTPQSLALLKQSKKPEVLLGKELPPREVIDILKKKSSAFGLIMTGEESARSYFQKLNEAMERIGPEHLSVINEECLWGEEGKEQMFRLISEILKANYGRVDIMKIFSLTFLRVLDEARR